jgi:hypothetical protein
MKKINVIIRDEKNLIICDEFIEVEGVQPILKLIEKYEIENK